MNQVLKVTLLTDKNRGIDKGVSKGSLDYKELFWLIH